MPNIVYYSLSSSSRCFAPQAPTNEAFAKIPADELNYLLQHPDVLRDVLFYHILDHRVYAQEITNFGHAVTLNRQELIFFVNSSAVVSYACP